MSERMDAIREKAHERYPDMPDGINFNPKAPKSRKDYLAGATESLTYTDEDVERAARALTPPDINPDLMGVLQVWDGGSTDAGWESWACEAIAALEAFGARRAGR